MAYFIIRKYNLLDFREEGFNSNEFKSRGLHEKHGVATWKLGKISAFP
jgi:hypothetical protein